MEPWFALTLLLVVLLLALFRWGLLDLLRRYLRSVGPGHARPIACDHGRRDGDCLLCQGDEAW